MLKRGLACKGFLLISLLVTFLSADSQIKKLLYDVIRNDKVIGKIVFVEAAEGQKRMFTMHSEVKTRFLFAFSDITSETAVYDNGILVHSTFKQKQTGSGDVEKSTTYTGTGYKLTKNGESRFVNFTPITFGMLRMYVDVPENVFKIYSGNYQQLLDLKKIGENQYKLTVPDGYNLYTYRNGICAKVEVERKLVSLQFVLKSVL